MEDVKVNLEKLEKEIRFKDKKKKKKSREFSDGFRIPKKQPYKRQKVSARIV